MVKVFKDGVIGWGECVFYVCYDEMFEFVIVEIEGFFVDFIWVEL